MPIKKLVILVALIGLLTGFYCLTIIVRVSLAEQKYFGKSTLIPCSLTSLAYNENGTAQSYFSPTYTFTRPGGQQIKVHKQLINGFQHSFGSALADYEFGNHFSDWLFRANEYFESYIFCRKTCGTTDYSLDTRKDLANNKIGRSIGKEAKKQKLFGQSGYKYILARTLQCCDDQTIYPHLKDPRVAKLPTEEQFGCYGLYWSNPRRM